MTNDVERKLEKFVNSSGFPFQIALQHLIESTKNDHGWEVLSHEHPWANEEAGSAGFIDLVLVENRGIQIMVVECKRVRDTYWVFLVPSARQMVRRHATCWITQKFYTKKDMEKFNWRNLNIIPDSPEAEFCIVPGQDNRSKPMLEKTAAEVIDATEALAEEEFAINKSSQEFRRLYFSVIITTADLKICRFNPEEINVNTGDIKNPTFESVPFLRFRKSLSTRSDKRSTSETIFDVIREKERTVFVINANETANFLKAWELVPGQGLFE